MFASTCSVRRKSLDELLRLLREPGFILLFRRPPVEGERPGHVSLSILRQSPPKSRYVRHWRRHARRCPSCAEIFRFVGME